MQRDSIDYDEETDMPTDVGTQSDPTRYANRGGTPAAMYCENPVMYDGTSTADADFGTEKSSHTWPGTIALAGAGLASAFLMAFLTLGMVRSTEPVEATPQTPIIHSVTMVPADRESVTAGDAGQQSTHTIVIAPSMRPETATVGPTPDRPATITVTTSEPPPATMTNPLEPPPATMTNPLEPPIGAPGESD